MQNHVPDQIRFLFKNAEGVAQHLIVYFTFRSKVKNNYTIGPKVTDSNGEIVVTRQSVEKKYPPTSMIFQWITMVT